MKNIENLDGEGPTPARKECIENPLEPMLSIGFVLIGPTSNIYKVSQAFGEILPDYPEVRVVYKKSSLGRLWIADEKPRG